MNPLSINARPEQIFQRVTASSNDILYYPATERILNNLKKLNLLPKEFIKPEVVDTTTLSHQLMFEATRKTAPYNHPVVLGKQILHLTTQPGTLIKQCPGSNNMLCCHYHIVNMVSNCPYDCSYCYLQTYLNQPMVTFYVNEEDIFEQVRKLCTHPPVSLLRIGTGEISDSLALDPVTEFSEHLIEVMAPFKNVRLELKTKSKNVEHLLHVPKKDHVIMAWSINPPEIINHEEHGTARFEERLWAAELATAAGFHVAFHFDPMIFVKNWEILYEETVNKILDTIPHHLISWISIGGLRYQPQLKPFLLARRPDSFLFNEEQVRGEDGKVRYLRSKRTEMFQTLDGFIKRKAPQVYTYLCMETKPVWENALGRLPNRGF